MKHVLRTLFPILVGGAMLAGCGHSVVPDHTADSAAAPAPVSSAPGGAWTVSPRTVPPPAQASAELRGSIAAAPVPDAAATAQFAPSTPEGVGGGAGPVRWPAGRGRHRRAVGRALGHHRAGRHHGRQGVSRAAGPGVAGPCGPSVRPRARWGVCLWWRRGERVRSCGHRRRRWDSGGVHRLPHAAGPPVPGRRRRRGCRLGASADRATRVGDRPRWDVGRWGIGPGGHALGSWSAVWTCQARSTPARRGRTSPRRATRNSRTRESTGCSSATTACSRPPRTSTRATTT